MTDAILPGTPTQERQESLPFGGLTPGVPGVPLSHAFDYERPVGQVSRPVLFPGRRSIMPAPWGVVR